MISETIKNRIVSAGGSFRANDNISDFIHPGELTALQDEVENRIRDLLQSLIIDTDNDHNTRETARRVAKMYLREVFKGRYEPRPLITEFPNFKNMDELYTLGPIKFKSACSHHFVEIEGQVWVGVQPSDRVVGISKIARLVHWIARRPQIQEECTVLLADELESLLKPKGLGVVIKAAHHCMTWRGVEEEQSQMITSVVRGEMLQDDSLKAEFFQLIRAQGFK
jgi:GTP cyclohydrolase I